MNKSDNLNKENNFSVPKDYFDHLPTQVTERIHSEKNKKETIFILKPSFLIPSLAVVVAVILLIFLFPKNNSQEIILSDNEVQQIIDNADLYNIDENSIADKYISENIPDETSGMANAISDDDAKKFLEENPDVNNIINDSL